MLIGFAIKSESSLKSYLIFNVFQYVSVAVSLLLVLVCFLRHVFLEICCGPKKKSLEVCMKENIHAVLERGCHITLRAKQLIPDLVWSLVCAQ